MSNIKKVLDDVKAGLQVEKPKIIKPAIVENENIVNMEADKEQKQQPQTKKKKELSDKQKEALKQGQLKRMEILRLKKEEIRQAKLSKGESTDYNKPDSLKNKLKNLDKIDELIKKLSVLEESKKTPINMNEKEITKQKEIILEEDKPKEEIDIKPKINVEDTINKEDEHVNINKLSNPADELKHPDNDKTQFNIRRKLTSGIVKPEYKIPVFNKKLNPYTQNK